MNQIYLKRRGAVLILQFSFFMVRLGRWTLYAPSMIWFGRRGCSGTHTSWSFCRITLERKTLAKETR